MKKPIKLPEPIETYIRGVNAGNPDILESAFAGDAVVSDVGPPIHGLAAIMSWAEREIFSVSVLLRVMDVADRDGETIVTVKVDGTFDRTGLPSPLIMQQGFTLADGKIATLTCRLATGG